MGGGRPELDAGGVGAVGLRDAEELVDARQLVALVVLLLLEEREGVAAAEEARLGADDGLGVAAGALVERFDGAEPREDGVPVRQRLGGGLGAEAAQHAELPRRGGLARLHVGLAGVRARGGDGVVVGVALRLRARRADRVLEGVRHDERAQRLPAQAEAQRVVLLLGVEHVGELEAGADAALEVVEGALEAVGLVGERRERAARAGAAQARVRVDDNDAAIRSDFLFLSSSSEIEN